MKMTNKMVVVIEVVTTIIFIIKVINFSIEAIKIIIVIIMIVVIAVEEVVIIDLSFRVCLEMKKMIIFVAVKKQQLQHLMND